LIHAADWPSVSIVHQVPIPPEIKSILDSLSIRPASTSRASSVPSMDRRSSANSSPSHKSNLTLAKSPAIAIPTKARPGGSPQPNSSLVATTPRGFGSTPSSVPSSSMEHFLTIRRQAHPEIEKRPDAPHSSHSSPARKNVDLEASLSRRNSGSRPSVTAITQLLAAATLSTDSQPQSIRRCASVSGPSSTPLKTTPSPPGTRPIERGTSSLASRLPPKRPSINISSASSSSGSSDGLGSATDGTVTSDGGFTDYLSDESEAELQRQAEARAALVAQNQAEEQEFRAARQQLAHVDLQPPKSWNLPRFTGSSAHPIRCFTVFIEFYGIYRNRSQRLVLTTWCIRP
jgi:hypothetical protein